jgi:hypothetical protein
MNSRFGQPVWVGGIFAFIAACIFLLLAFSANMSTGTVHDWQALGLFFLACAVFL